MPGPESTLFKARDAGDRGGMLGREQEVRSGRDRDITLLLEILLGGSSSSWTIGGMDPAEPTEL